MLRTLTPSPELSPRVLAKSEKKGPPAAPRRRSLPRLSDLDTFGKRLKLARLDLGLTQDDLVKAMQEQAGVATVHSYISQLENGDQLPGGELIRALALALGISADYLLLISDNPWGDRRNPTPLDLLWEQLDDQRREELLAIGEAMLATDSAVQRQRLLDVERTLLLIEQRGGPDTRRLAESLLPRP